MKKIGLTGTTGSGKGLVGRLLRSFGCFVIDTDALYHGLISSDSALSREIISRFGKEVALESGGVFRPNLAKIVFSDPQALSDLNTIAHSYVVRECDNIISGLPEGSFDIVVIDAPQLFEAHMDEICDATVAVVSDVNTRLERICARDSISREQAQARIDAQHTDEFFLAACDYVIHNDSDAARLLVRVKSVLDEIKE